MDICVLKNAKISSTPWKLVPSKIKSPYNLFIKYMTKEVILTISERVAATKIINSFKGNLDQLVLMLADLKNIAITAEEWVKAELVKTPIMENGVATGQESWNWNDHSPELDKTIALESPVVLFMLNDIKDRETKNEITMADAALITLKTKLQ